jgi:hypothetical protein
MLEKNADGSVLHPAELKRLQIFWIRLNRLTTQLKKDLEEGTFLIASKQQSTVH